MYEENKLYDIDGNELDESTVDLTKGHIDYEQAIKAHHKAKKATEAVYEDRILAGTENMAPGGLHQMYLVKPAMPAQEAWDEYVGIRRYKEYTQEELDAMNNPPVSELDKIAAQVLYTAMLTDTIIPEGDTNENTN